MADRYTQSRTTTTESLDSTFSISTTMTSTIVFPGIGGGAGKDLVVGVKAIAALAHGSKLDHFEV
jgi:hypothetical protein